MCPEMHLQADPEFFLGPANLKVPQQHLGMRPMGSWAIQVLRRKSKGNRRPLVQGCLVAPSLGVLV